MNTMFVVSTHVCWENRSAVLRGFQTRESAEQFMAHCDRVLTLVCQILNVNEEFDDSVPLTESERSRIDQLMIDLWGDDNFFVLGDRFFTVKEIPVSK